MHLSITTVFLLFLAILIQPTPIKGSDLLPISSLASSPLQPQPRKQPQPQPQSTPTTSPLLNARQIAPPLAGGRVANPFPSPSQAPATTTYPILSFDSHVGATVISVPYTQLFSSGAIDQWPGPSQGRVGIASFDTTASTTQKKHHDVAPIPITTSIVDVNRQGREVDIGINSHIQGMPVRSNASSHVTFLENGGGGLVLGRLRRPRKTVVAAVAVSFATLAWTCTALV